LVKIAVINYHNIGPRYDYEECAGDPCNEMMNRLQEFVDNKGPILQNSIPAQNVFA
jgi:hypothetical protein